MRERERENGESCIMDGELGGNQQLNKMSICVFLPQAKYITLITERGCISSAVLLLRCVYAFEMLSWVLLFQSEFNSFCSCVCEQT